jgi:hypothetical protein
MKARLSLLAFVLLSTVISVAGADSKSSPAPALSNTSGQSELFLGYSFVKTDTSKTYYLQGENFAYTYFLGPHVGITADGDFHVKPSFDLVSASGRVGPRVNFRSGRVVPFAHFLMGYNYWQVHGAFQSPQKTPNLPLTVQHGLTYGGGGGVDVKVSPSWSIRPVQCDIMLMRSIHDYSAGSGSGSQWLRMSFGAVYRFGASR